MAPRARAAAFVSSSLPNDSSARVSDLIDIVYVSSAVRLLDDAELLEILRTSRRNNERDGITGLLLYENGNFMQVLEGERAAVEQTWNRIVADPRHRNVTRLMRSEIEHRLFGEWSMAFRDMRAVPEADRSATSRFLQRGEPDPAVFGDPGRAHEMLLTFRSLIS